MESVCAKHEYSCAKWLFIALVIKDFDVEIWGSNMGQAETFMYHHIWKLFSPL